jgi:hypothetical protein
MQSDPAPSGRSITSYGKFAYGKATGQPQRFFATAFGGSTCHGTIPLYPGRVGPPFVWECTIDS